MIKKDSLGLIAILLFAIIFLLIQISFISSEGIKTFTESTKIGNLFGLNEEDIIVSAEIQYLEIKDLETKEKKVRLTFIEENAKVNINGNLFTNIVPQKIAGHPTYIELNKYGEIVKADFTVNEKGGNYTFGDNTIEVPPNSRVFFDENTGIDIKIPDGLDLTEFPNLLKYIPDGYLTTIKGKEIILPNGINLVDGELSIEEKGYFLENGEAIYKQNLLKVDKDDKKILIVNSDADMSDYEGNWIRQTADILELQSSKEGYIDVDFLGDHEILNTDDKDKLSANIWKGDGLKFEDRDEKGLIPKAIHKSSERGGTTIENDKIEFAFNKRGFFILPRPLEIEDITSNKYQSAAFEIESDSPEIDDKLRINSYRQFVILSEDDKELITYNKYGLPISAKVKDNELQTIEQIREKYPDLEFGVSKYTTEFDEDNMPPYLLYFTDYFIKLNPEVPQNFDEVIYSDRAGASVSGWGGFARLEIGRKIVDPSSFEIFKLRNAKTPLQVLGHEYEHRLNGIIEDKEIEFLKSLNDPQLNILIKDYEEEIERLKKEHPERLSILKVQEMNKLKKLAKSVGREYYQKTGRLLLQQKYNNLINEAGDKINKERFGNSLKNLLGDLEKDYGSYIKEKLTEVTERNLGLSLEEYLEELGEDKENINMNLMEGVMAILIRSEEREKISEEDLKILGKLKVFPTYLRDLDTGIDMGKDNKELLETLNSIYWKLPSESKQAKQYYRNRIDQIVRNNAGLPYAYSIHNYNQKNNDIFYASYEELSSTYREDSIGTRRMEVQSANPSVSEMYKQLTQVAFDSGKMKVEEYRAIMGEEHCKETDCSDKLCVEYKLLCCEKHPSSPYCPKNPIY